MIHEITNFVNFLKTNQKINTTNDLSTHIASNQELVQVDVEIRPMTKVLSLINDHLKSQDQRISILEEEIKTFLMKSKYDSDHDALIKRVSETEDRMSQTSKRISSLNNNVQSLEAQLNQTLESQISNVLVTTNTRIKNAAQSFDSQFELVNNQISTLKNQLNHLNNEQEKVDLTVFGNFIKQNTLDIESIKQELNIIGSKFYSENPQAILYSSNIHKEKTYFKDIDTSGLNMKISDNSTLLNQINQQKDVLLEVVSELNKIKEKMSMPLMPPPQIIETKTIIEEKVVDSRKNAMSNRTSVTNGGLNTVKLETELSKLENDFDSHQSKVVAAMNAIQFELQQIRDHGEGLKGLPPLNLANVVPSFFNNPSFTFSRHENEEEDSYEIDENQSLDGCRSQNDIEIERLDEIKIDRDKKPSMMKLRIQQVGSDSDADESDMRAPKEIKMKKKKKKKRNSTESDATFKDEGSSPKIIQKPELNISEIIEKIKQEIDVQTIHNTFIKINNEYTEVMSAIERKIDRDYVERLFDKFRSIIHGINDRVKELADLNNEFATRQDFLNLLQLVKNMPKEIRPGSVLKKGPACLFCGKPKTSLAGSIPPNVAANAGKPPVGSVMADGNSVEYVYGEGQAFIRSDANFQSFPRFDALPPLDKLSSSDLSKINSNSLNTKGS